MRNTSEICNLAACITFDLLRVALMDGNWWADVQFRSLWLVFIQRKKKLSKLKLFVRSNQWIIWSHTYLTRCFRIRVAFVLWLIALGWRHEFENDFFNLRFDWTWTWSCLLCSFSEFLLHPPPPHHWNPSRIWPEWIAMDWTRIIAKSNCQPVLILFLFVSESE